MITSDPAVMWHGRIPAGIGPLGGLDIYLHANCVFLFAAPLMMDAREIIAKRKGAI